MEFRFTAHSTMGIVNSILECLIYTDRSDEAVGIPLQFVTDYLDTDVAVPLSIPLISNEKCMCEAFDCLGGVILRLFDKISDICYDSYKCEKLNQFFIEELYGLYGIKDDDKVLMPMIDYRFLTLRFTSDAYILNIKGKREKAIKKLEKCKNLSGYEKRLLRLWKNSSNDDTIPSVKYNAELYNDSCVPKNDGKEFLSAFISWIVMTPVISIFYVGLYFCLMRLEGRDSVYLMGPMHYFPYSIIFAFVTSIAASYFCRHFAYKIIFKKHYERYCEIDSIQNGGGADKLMHVFLWFTVLASIIGCILFTKWNMNFKKDGFVDNTKFLSVTGTYHSYSDIDRLYYKPNRENDYGETLEYASYVMELRDGTEIDFYDFDSIEGYEDVLLDHLRSKGVKIEGPKE